MLQFLAIDTVSAMCTAKCEVCKTIKPILSRTLHDVEDLERFNQTTYITTTWPNVDNNLVLATNVMEGICNMILLREMDEDTQLDEIEEKACLWLYNETADSVPPECGAQIRYYCFRKEVSEYSVRRLEALINNDLLCSECRNS